MMLALVASVHAAPASVGKREEDLDIQGPSKAAGDNGFDLVTLSAEEETRYLTFSVATLEEIVNSDKYAGCETKYTSSCDSIIAAYEGPQGETEGEPVEGILLQLGGCGTPINVTLVEGQESGNLQMTDVLPYSFAGDCTESYLTGKAASVRQRLSAGHTHGEARAHVRATPRAMANLRRPATDSRRAAELRDRRAGQR